MTYTKLAIIGTAGRKEDSDRLKADHYQRMVESSIKLMTYLNIDPRNLSLISGGAAWADHIVVSLAIMGVVDYKDVTIYIPASLEESGYTGTNEWENKVASTANYYHTEFYKKVGSRSIEELNFIRSKGSLLDSSKKGFKTRNTSVANSVKDNGILLAYTFGNGITDQLPWTIRSFDPGTNADAAGLKDGGTADTWNKCPTRKFHCRLGD